VNDVRIHDTSVLLKLTYFLFYFNTFLVLYSRQVHVCRNSHLWKVSLNHCSEENSHNMKATSYALRWK
jgi:hypothetical protein